MAPKPIIYQVYPVGGLDYSKPPQQIKLQKSNSMMNVRFRKGQLVFRDGFAPRYSGASEPILWVGSLSVGGFSAVIAISASAVYYVSSSFLEDVDLFNESGSPISYPYLNMDMTLDNISVTRGNAQYDFNGANEGNIYPSIDYTGEVMVFCNRTYDGIFVIALTGNETPVEGERIGADGCPTLARAVVVFDGRLYALGTQNSPSEIAWCSKGRFDRWDPGTYLDAGSTVLLDSPDYIQAGYVLGDYLVVYKERAIYVGRKTYLSDPPVRFDLVPSEGIGLSAPNTVGDMGNAHVFLGWDNVHIFSLNGIKDIGTEIRDELFGGDLGILPKYIENCIGRVVREFDEYWLFIPTGAWPGDADGEPLFSIVSNPVFTHSTGGSPDDWTSYGGATIGTQEVGNIGKNAMRITGVGDWHGAQSNTYDFDSELNGHEFAVVAFIKGVTDALSAGEVTGKVRLRFFNSGGSSVGTEDVATFSLNLNDTGYTRIAGSATLSTGAEQVAVEIIVEDAGDQVDVDAVHVIDITGVPSTHLVSGDNGNELGYIGPMEEPVALFFVVDEVGPNLLDTVWVYNYLYNEWSVWRLPISGFGFDSLEDITSIGSLSGTIAEQEWRFDERNRSKITPASLLGMSDGCIYRVSDSLSHDYENSPLESTFDGYWESKDFDLNAPAMDKTASMLYIHHRTSHTDQYITVDISTDSGRTWVAEQDIEIQAGDSETIVTFFVTGPQIRFRIKAKSPGFELTGFGIEIIPRGSVYAY